MLVKKINLLLSVLIFLLMVSNSQAASLNLTLKLPSGEIAEKRLDYRVLIKDDTPGITSNPRTYTAILLINQGENSGATSIPYSGFNGQTVSIMFTDSTGVNNPAYLDTFYFSNTSQGHATWSSCNKSKITTDIDKSLIVEIPRGRTIKGTLALPAGEYVNTTNYLAATNTIAATAEFEADGKYYKDIGIYSIPVGENSVDYILTVPDVQGGSTLVHYQGSHGNFTNPPVLSYLSIGYYGGQQTVFSREMAVPLPNGNHTNINLSYIKGARIKGTLKLPSGTAPIDLPVHINVEVLDNNKWEHLYASSYIFQQGHDSVEYSISVSKQDFGKPLRISYQLQDDLHISCWIEKYVPIGYLGIKDMTWDINAAENFTINNDYTNLDLTVLSGWRFTGALEYYSATTPYTATVTLVSSNRELSLTQGWTIPLFNPINTPIQSEYCFIVPDATDVNYYLGYNAGFIYADSFQSIGYFKNNGGTTGLYSELTDLPADKDRSNLDFSIINQTSQFITGKLILPENQVAQSDQGLAFLIIAFPDTPFIDTTFIRIDINTRNGIIEKGTNSVQFTIPIPPDPSTRWYVQATPIFSCSPFTNIDEQLYPYSTYYPHSDAIQQAQTVSYLDGPITIEILKRAQPFQQTNGGILQMMTAILAAQNN